MDHDTPVPTILYSNQMPKSNASRASAMMATSVQQLNYNTQSQNIKEGTSENTYVAPKQLQNKQNHSDIHMDTVITASTIKKSLLETYEYTPPKIFNDNRKVQLVQCRSPNPGEVDPSLISTLSINLLNILNTVSDKNEILNEFNRHTTRVRISQEEAIHKYALEKTRIIKDAYFTSDT